ncbi:PREDICTED: uncharacterized protein LOC108968968 [Bactrocera latifrons]|uniref:Uncharacterized protein n=2 Tax=Bactrocera latifrons TaxID=174628 RepID=A0A0K8TXR3_BACLA|nr:PREDICTED: uncharacterized protein LOC108968968 [Bactrocera latifrons]
MDESIESKINQSPDDSFERLLHSTEDAPVESIKSNKGDTEPQNSDEKPEKTGKKRVSTEKTHVYGYMKKKVLNHLLENGCSSHSVDEVIAASKFNKNSVLEYMNQRIQMAQENVHEECDSLSFSNIESWLQVFKKWNLPELCLYEPALVINAIANNEDLPEPKELDGVDLKSVYKFLGNALMGLPQPNLDAKSAEFLAKEFEILVGEANTEVGDSETGRINQKLETYKELPFCTQREKSSIDPLCLSDNLNFQRK